jgi:hypothetical protein
MLYTVDAFRQRERASSYRAPCERADIWAPYLQQPERVMPSRSGRPSKMTEGGPGGKGNVAGGPLTCEVSALQHISTEFKALAKVLHSTDLSHQA